MLVDLVQVVNMGMFSVKELTEEIKEAELQDLLALKNSDRKEMITAFLDSLSEEDIFFYKKTIKDNPNGVWATTVNTDGPIPYPFHFRKGMEIRNFFRSNGFNEKTLGIQNLDNVYVSVVEEAITSLPDDYTPPKKSFLSKIKSFFL